MSDKRDWPAYNESLVRRGQIILDTDFVNTWPDELAKMNYKKEGKPFDYPDSLIRLLATVHVYLLPYRQLEGFTRALLYHTKFDAPDFTSIAWRVAKIKTELQLQFDHITNDNQTDDDEIIIAIDSTGLKVQNRGEWIRHKWKVKRGFIKMHIAVDIKTKKIVSIQITKEDVHDTKQFEDLLNDTSITASRNGKKISRVILDGAYDTKANFWSYSQRDIDPAILVRKNASTKARGCMPRKLSVLEQKNNLKQWKKNHDYGYRWMAESGFSSFKRQFGECVTSIKWSNIINEIMLKASIYNMFISMNPRM